MLDQDQDQDQHPKNEKKKKSEKREPIRIIFPQKHQQHHSKDESVTYEPSSPPESESMESTEKTMKTST